MAGFFYSLFTVFSHLFFCRNLKAPALPFVKIASNKGYDCLMNNNNKFHVQNEACERLHLAKTPLERATINCTALKTLKNV